MTTKEKTRESRDPKTSVRRLVELIEDPDIVVSINAMTHPKIQQFGGQALDLDFTNFHRAVEQWILGSGLGDK